MTHRDIPEALKEPCIFGLDQTTWTALRQPWRAWWPELMNHENCDDDLVLLWVSWKFQEARLFDKLWLTWQKKDDVDKIAKCKQCIRSALLTIFDKN
jgi:hypothetical protein